ncbi:MAG TPA: ABC transporter ATP-binding protein [Candidatus Paceibacterota bacterium]|nr:ABC transporter ATP-binding protein [Candidatus Paceibacterota bacterium]
MLTIKNLKVGYYGGVDILHDVDIGVKPGEIVALIGPNGAGKSTVLRSIFNQAEVRGGSIKFIDDELTNLPTHSLIRLGISFVPQGRQVFSTMTVKENLEMGAFAVADQNLVEENIENIYKRFPILKDKMKQAGANLSGGQQQILAIARALMQNPKLLLLDEPSLGLSPKAMHEIFAIIKEINKEGVSVLMVEQNARAAVEIAHRTYILEMGKVALSGGPDILENEKVKRIYFGRD